MAFTPEQLLESLPGADIHCLVAFSGGMDSHVLLHALAMLRRSGAFTGSLQAIHVNHGLNPLADSWAVHCRAVCAELDVPLAIEQVSVSRQGHGIEQAAREARYGVFSRRLQPGSVLLTAHHLDDQLETLLFRMLRGTGLRGLAGIRRRRPLARGTLLRPLLDYSREDLHAYAEGQQLQWIDDSSNDDESLDRNFLRHRIMPELATRWPGYRKNWQRLAGLAEESQLLQEEVGFADLQQVRTAVYKLSIAALQAFSLVRQRNILRCWLLSLERESGIPAPDFYVIDRVFAELIPAAVDAAPVVAWQKGGRRMEIHRFAGHIYLVLPVAMPVSPVRIPWQCGQPLPLPEGLGILALVESDESGLVLPAHGQLQIGFRHGGESAKPAGRKTRPLKKILQDYHVPPWLRDQVPLVYCGDDLVAVADLFVCDSWQVSRTQAQGRKMYRIMWQKTDLHCGY